VCTYTGIAISGFGEEEGGGGRGRGKGDEIIKRNEMIILMK